MRDCPARRIAVHFRRIQMHMGVDHQHGVKIVRCSAKDNLQVIRPLALNSVMPKKPPVDSTLHSTPEPDFTALIAELQHAIGSVANPQMIDERPLYGTTLFLATCPLATRFGLFRAYIFQDLID